MEHTPYRFRLQLVRDEAEPPYGEQFLRAVDVADIARRILDGEPQEVVLAFFADTKHRVRGYLEVARGSMTEAKVDPKVLFSATLLAGATALCVVHNHLSGDPTPSANDRAHARALKEAADVLGIELVDYIVVAGDRHHSMRGDAIL